MLDVDEAGGALGELNTVGTGVAELDGERYSINLIRLNTLSIECFFTLAVWHLDLEAVVHLSGLEHNSLHLDRDEVLVLDGGFLAWDGLLVADSVDNAGDFSVATVSTGKHDEDGLITAAAINSSVRESDAAWLVIILDENRALSIVSFKTLLGGFVNELDLEFLIRLPVLVFVDLDLNFSLGLFSVHGEKLVLLLVVLTSLGGDVNGTDPESVVAFDLLLNGDVDVAVALSDLVTEVLEADSLAIVDSGLLLVFSLADGTLVDSSEGLGVVVTNLLTERDTLNGVLWVEALEKLVDGGLLRVSPLGSVLEVHDVLGEENGVVLVDVIDVSLAHLLVLVEKLDFLAVTDFKHGSNTEFLS